MTQALNGTLGPEARRKVTGGDGTVDRFPDVVRLRDGRLMLGYRELDGDQRFRDPTRRLALLFSDDEGETWGGRRTFFDDDHRSDGVFPSNDYFRFSRLPDDRLVMASGSVIRSGGEERREAAWTETMDEGETWFPPRPLGFPARNAYRVRALADGALAMPAQWSEEIDWPSHDPGYARRSSVGFYVTEDGGESWELRSTLYDGPMFPMQICEPDCVVLGDGTVRLYSRDELGFGPGMLFTSRDHGRTWSSEPMRFLGHHLAADVVEETGRPLVCFRACHVKWAPAVGAWLDDGSCWGRLLQIHRGAPAGRYHADVGQWVRLRDGRFLVPYSITTEEEKEVHVWVATFRLEDFVAPAGG